RYDGPCPPKGRGVHHYHFRLLALDVERLSLPGDASVVRVADAARGHVLAEAQLIGTYAR
ncbi:MAG TPA: YbhB/YbcL family Raf kinase inhibitor-like protein, partial [Candidatus Sulfotelmatobacter sp.]|nr:YbhB/YbcL family Raf kinase inhibitor-like protein [Candidatus Sulfotelmatobacter sp.]